MGRSDAGVIYRQWIKRRKWAQFCAGAVSWGRSVFPRIYIVEPKFYYAASCVIFNACSDELGHSV